MSAPDSKPHPTHNVYIVRVSEEPGFRDVRFTNKADADKFADEAIDDGTFWGREERIVEGTPNEYP